MPENNKHLLLRQVGVITWVSFVAASVATMVFFAMFDPETLGQVTTWPISITRTEGYSIGFLLFWALTLTTASITTFLLSLPPKKSMKASQSNQTD